MALIDAFRECILKLTAARESARISARSRRKAGKANLEADKAEAQTMLLEREVAEATDRLSKHLNEHHVYVYAGHAAFRVAGEVTIRPVREIANHQDNGERHGSR